MIKVYFATKLGLITFTVRFAYPFYRLLQADGAKRQCEHAGGDRQPELYGDFVQSVSGISGIC